MGKGWVNETYVRSMLRAKEVRRVITQKMAANDQY